MCDTKWFAFRNLKWNWDCKCNRIFDSHSSTPFLDKSNDRYYSLLEFALTCPSQSDVSQECQHRMVLGLSMGISISISTTALLTCIQKSQHFLVYIQGNKFGFAEVNFNRYITVW